MGTVQLTERPVQPAYVMYVTPFLCRISTVYPVIADPLSAGAVQLIATSVVPEIEVTRAEGVLGALIIVDVITWVLVTNGLLAN